MKNLKLNRTPIDIGVMKKHLFLKSLLIAIGLLVTGLTTQVWAAQTYNYAGEKSSWSNATMTVSDDGFYEYYEVTASGDHEFKIRPNDDDGNWTKALTYLYSQPGFNSTNFSSSGDRGMSPSDNSWGTGGNIKIYTSSNITYYILVYYKNTAVNATSSPIVCAATYLPYNASYRQYFVNTSSWSTPLNAYAWYYQNSTVGTNNASWPGSAMTSTGKTLNGKTIYYIDLAQVYDKIIFNYNGADATKTGDLSLGTTYKGKMYNGSTWVTYQFDITLDQQSGSGGTSSVIGVVGSGMPSSKDAPSRTGYNFGGYYTAKNGGGTCYYNASMVSQTNVSASTPSTLYAKWTKKTFTVTVNNDGHGSTEPSGAQTSIAQVDGIAISAEADEDYEFVNWTLESGTGSFTDATSESTTFYPTSAATIQANFRSTVTNSLTVIAGSGISSVTGSMDPVTLGSSYAITATPLTGYSFSTWTADVPANASFASATSASTNVTVSNGSVTVTASATEDKRTLTPTVDYDHGSSSYTATADNQIGVTTASRIKCSKPNANHYTFAGWTLTNLTVTSGNASTDTIIYVKVNNPANACSAVAKYEEVLEQSTWVIKGGSAYGGTAWTTEHALAKKSGYSTSDVVYHTFSIASTNNTADVGNDNFNFKVVKKGASDTYYGLGTGDGQWWYYRDTDPAEQTLGTSNKDIQIRADVAGNYEVKVDYSDASNPTVTITFPTSYQVNYEVGTVKGASDDPSAKDNESNAISDGDLVLSGTEVTFTAAEAADGYTWAGWYDAATTAGTKLSVGTAQTYTTTISAATTVYAVYTENLYTVTVSAGDHGSISVPVGGTVSAGADTKPTITASPSTNYAFKWWSNTDGNVTATDWNLASTTVSATAAGTITANFFPQWALAGGDWNNTADDSDALGDWDTWTNGFEGFGTNASSEDTCIVSVTLPANTDFKFKIVDHRTGDWYGNSTSGIFKMTYADDNGKYWEGHVNSGSDEYQEFGLATAGAGSYKFAWNKTDKKAAVFFPTSYKVTFGYGTGGTSVSASVSGSGAGAIANNQYAASGSNITFSESHSNGYTFKGWYDAASGGLAVATMGKEDPILNSIAADASVYAQYTENMTTVTLANNGHGHVEIGGEPVTSTTAGVTTTRSITAVPDAGYYFSGWTITEGTDFHLNGYTEANATATLTGNGGGETSGQTLTANFVELDKIYFRNIFDDGEGNVTRWENVYVHFDITWTEHDGKQAVQTSSDNISKGLHCSMTKIGTSDVYWAYVPRYITTNSKTSVAFADHDDSYNNSKLWEGNAAGRGDYNPLLNMFVPHHTKLYSTNNVDYYSNGYWMKYDTRASQGAGYYLKVYNSRNNYTEKGEFTANTDDATMIRFQVRVDNTNADKTRFMITSAGGLNYIADATVTSVSGAVEVSENLRTLTDNDVYFQLTATSEGYYTFILDQTGDEMKLSVDYPVAVGDYRLKHTYTIDAVAHTTYSDIIKSADAATGVIASMYLNTSNSPTFVLEKCTAVSPKIVWTQQGSDLWSAQSGNFNKGKGVYQFDITITDGTTSTINSITEAKPYEGNYYIKTDCAPGGWTAYKSNVLDKNTINFDRTSNTFDYYMCRNTRVDNKNVKFVIANDYNIAVTDTIDADATYLTGGNNENVPEACCVRFSYNSVTNDAKRAYLRYSSNNNFLNIIPSAASKVYDAASAGNDLYGASGAASANNKFGDDDGNFVYRKTVYAVSGASIDVKAEYTNSSKIQPFVSGHELITSSNTSTRYPIQVVYDFKTNNLTTAWHPGEEPISDEISKVDYMYIRNGQAAADQLTFSGSGALTDAKVCGAFQFAYDDYVGRVGAWPQYGEEDPGYTYSKCMFYFSFPFNVKVSDIFGIGTYGKEWKIQYYDGAERAKKGFFRGDGTTTFWKDMSLGDTLKAYIGYSLLLDNDYFNTTAEGMVFNGKSAGSSVYLYFPSYQTMSTVAHTSQTITVPSYPCTLPHSWVDPVTKNTLYHSKTDSHWNMLGVPLLNSHTGDFSEYFVESGLSYLYEWDPASNTLNPAATGSDAGAVGNFTFQAMGAYMVQFTGPITFTGSVPTPSSVAARQKQEEKNYTIDLEVLDAEDTRINHTYVELRDGASDDFMLNEDMYMSPNSKDVNIYSFAGAYDVAANVLSVENHVVPVGVSVKKAGTYKFSMPYEFSGTVTLVDKFNNTRTNLAFDEYEVYLEKGSINDRFDMEINIRKVPTSIENIDGNNALNDGGVHKFIENDQMYILKNGTIYNAQGAKVK